MPRIDFYLIKENYLEARNSFACRVVDKAYQQGHKVYIYTSTAEEAQRLNDLLWTFRDDSFIPHTVFGEISTITPPIQIGNQSPPQEHTDILINLTSQLPDFYRQFQRVIEIIPDIAELRNAARHAYRNYREAGNELQLHDLGKD